MKIAIFGSGHIGANIGLRAAEAGHQIAFSFSRNDKKLRELAEKAGAGASAAPVDGAIEHADFVVFSVPWDQRLSAIPDASLLNGKIVVDTTNQYGRDGVAPCPALPFRKTWLCSPARNSRRRSTH